MKPTKYTTDPKDIYTLELLKLQRSFEGLRQISADASQMQGVDWRQVERLKHVNFLVMEALHTGSELFMKQS